MGPPSVNTVPVLGFEAMHAQDEKIRGWLSSNNICLQPYEFMAFRRFEGFSAPELNHGTVYAVTSLSLA